MQDAKIISYREALKIVQTQAAAAAELATEAVPLAQALHRIVAFDVLSREVLPTFANSAMDGFAVRSRETLSASAQQPLRLPILGTVAAGDTPVDSETANSAWSIMTGAPFPDGYDACIRIEDIELRKDAQGNETHIVIRAPARPGENRREIGEDFQEGSVLLRRGQRVRAEDILALASLGVNQVSLFRRLKIGIISTGKELIANALSTPPAGHIRNSTGPYLMAALQARGHEAHAIGIVQDDPRQFHEFLRQIEKQNFDLILTTGAISMGKHDFVGHALEEVETEFYFRKVSMRPGKPVLFGRLKSGGYLLGLPGNPISSAVGLRFFVDPFTRALLRQSPEEPLRLPLLQKTSKASSATFLKGCLVLGPQGSGVKLHAQQRPSLMHSLLQSEIWIALPEGPTELEEGSLVDVFSYLPL